MSNSSGGENHLYRLEMHSISKAFPGVQALDNVTFQLQPGEIHALLGENGAGKSTLIKIMSGAYPSDSGQIFLDGKPLAAYGPHQALQLGIVTIYQETNLAFDLSVAENIFMGRIPGTSRWRVNWKQLYSEAQALLAQLDAGFNAHDKVGSLSPAQRQMVEIAKALSTTAKVIVLDEPTASLTGREVTALFEVMTRLKSRGVSLILITHRLSEVFRICDRLTILRDGKWVNTAPVNEMDESRIVAQMVGRNLDDTPVNRRFQDGSVLLDVRGLCGHRFTDVSFEIHAGEIVGLFGLVGAGRTEVARAIFGAESISAGTLSINGKSLRPRSPQQAIDAGLALVPEDRKFQGLVLEMSVRQNIALPNLKRLSRLGILNPRAEDKLANDFKTMLDIRTPSIATRAQSLSGGNQQKIVMSKWLAKRPRVLILDEPTRGIDVAAKAEVHKLIHQLTDEGMGVLLISSELPEILAMSDRVLVMHEGRLVGELSREEASEEKIMSFTVGQTVADAAV
jgi:ABC-type sugar transport system ATPase subunit